MARGQPSLPHDVGRQTPEPVSRDLRVTAVGVDQAHHDLVSLHTIEDDAIGAGTFVAIAEASRPGRSLGGRKAAGHEEEVVAESLGLREPHGITSSAS
jgi:hypothetical protein